MAENGYNSPYTGEYMDRKLAPIKHKSVTLEPSNWALFEGAHKREITDADIVDGVEVSATWAANKTDRTNYLDAGVWAIATAGKITFYADTKPSVSINAVYTIKI